MPAHHQRRWSSIARDALRFSVSERHRSISENGFPDVATASLYAGLTPDQLDLPWNLESDENDEDEADYSLWGLVMTQAAHRAVMNHLLSRPVEAAGLLIGPAHDDALVTHFVPDEGGRSTPVSFELNTQHLNQVLRQIKPAGLACVGIVHSHPLGIPYPSQGDLHYFRKLFASPTNASTLQLFVPIVCGQRLYPWVFANDCIQPADLILV